MAFVQLIELVTTRPDDVEALVTRWREKTAGRRTAQRGTEDLTRLCDGPFLSRSLDVRSVQEM